MNPISGLSQKLERAFGTSDISERHRYALMLRAFSEFMRELGLPNEWQRKAWELGLALCELEEGISPEVLRPAARTDGGRPSDEWRVWIVRSRAVLALEARVRAKMSERDAVRDLRKLFPGLDAKPYVTGEGLKTSLSNWKRKMGDIKRGDHLDLVAETHEEARAKLAELSPQDAVVVADELLQNVLR